ncbi:MAG: hypothetical protein J6569_04685 [Gilliamella sp.]|uniref:zonular occludens toxin domain-containing protein n=1 Tax=Gilliamella sp. TaxID=1891236 RepID=UPI0025ED02F7|nr:zonular occludens toxin domain-containing protein [Gilliamella sp.]MCO6539416.1 hypothetical protein [Gilliamella sp.]
MAIYIVTGALGAGKGLFCDMIATQAYRAGRRVASNYPINTYLMDKNSQKSITVIPPKFTYDDLMALGRGCDENDLSQLGVLILDELAISLNSRNFKDNGRQKLLEYFIQSRKYGWDIYMQAQDAFMIDKQVVDAMTEFTVKLSRLDSLRVPFLSSFLELISPKTFGRTAKRKSILPHIVKYQIFHNSGGKPIEKGSFRAKDFFGLHDTNFIFENDETNDHIREMHHLDFVSQSQIDKDNEKQKPRFKNVIAFIKLLFCLLFFYVIYLCWSHFIFSDKKEKNTSTKSTVQQQHQSESTGTPHQLQQKEVSQSQLSTKYRIVGYLSTGQAFARFVIRDMQTNQIIYLMSDYAYNGLNTSIIYQSELVTYFSGVDSSESTNENLFFK